jgi:hypothetical protein
MLTIWRLRLTTETAFPMSVPRGAKLLSIQPERDSGYIAWFLADPGAERVTETWRCYCTGQVIDPDSLIGMEFVGTIQDRFRDWHFFRWPHEESKR